MDERDADCLPGHRIALLESGTQYFPALEAALDAAEFEVFLQTYLFENDETGRRIAAALIRCASRNVAVRLMVDGFGAREFVETMMPQLLQSGVQVLVFRRELGSFALRRHRLRRLHRKVAVIDGRLAFVGGINVIDDMHTPHHTPPRYDYAVSVEGPILAEILTSCRNLWEQVAWVNLRRRLLLRDTRPAKTDHVGERRARYVIRDNLRHRRDIEAAYLDAINNATREVLIANAYFLPGRRFRQALLHAAARGVSVRLLLQGRVEYLLLHYATRGLYGSLLEGGVRIVEYHSSFLHAKVAVIDGQWSTVGSSNIDPFSLLLAREANVIVRDAGFAAELRDSLERAIERGAAELKPAAWKRTPLLTRVTSWLAYGLVRLMMGITGFSRHH